MVDWIRVEKRERRGLTDKCSVTSSGIAIGRKYISRFKESRSVDVYRDAKGLHIGIVPRNDDKGYSLRVRGPGVAYVGTKNMIKRLNITRGRYPARWTNEKLNGEEKPVLVIDVKEKSHKE